MSVSQQDIGAILLAFDRLTKAFNAPTVNLFGTPVQYFNGTILGNTLLDASINGYDADIINNDIDSSIAGIPYTSLALIAQKAANFGKIPDPTNFWFTSAGVPNQIPVTSFFQNIDYVNQIFCKHSVQTLDSNNVEIIAPAVIEIVTYSAALTGTNLASANNYFNVSTVDTGAKWIDPVNGNDTTGTGTQLLPYKLHSKVNGLTLTEGILTYVKTGTVAPFAWNKNYQLKTVGITKILSTVSARGIDYDPAGTLAQELSGYIIDMANVASSVGINCNAILHALTIKKFKISNSAVAGIQSSTYSTQTLNVEDCVIDDTNFYGIYANKTINVSNSVINSSSYCIYKDTTNTLDITILNSKIINNSTSPFRLYSPTNLSMIGGTLEWSEQNMISNNVLSGGERNFNGVNINYTGDTVGSFINLTENLAVTKLDIRNCVLECPNMQGAISALDINGEFNFVNNIAYKTDPTGFNIAVFQKNFSTRTTVVNISNSIVRSDNPGASSPLTIGQDPHPNPNKITGVVEKMHFMHLNDLTAHGFIVLYENAGVTVQHCKFTGLPINGFKCHGESYILNIWKYNLHVNAPLLAKGVDYGIYYNNTIVINTYMADSAHLISVGNNAVPGPTVDSTNCQIKNHIVVYTGTGNNMNMVRLDHANNVIDYNIYYNKNFPCMFLYQNSPITFSQWQALGYDTNSVVLTDAQYEAMFEDADNDDYSIKSDFVWPINGVSTGNTTGLDASTTWGGPTSIPNVITKEQPLNYNIGAYIK